jgi:hypothetical protein
MTCVFSTPDGYVPFSLPSNRGGLGGATHALRPSGLKGQSPLPSLVQTQAIAR